MMIKTVLFDIDNTLYSYDDAHRAAYASLCRYAEERLGLDEETFTRLHSEANQEMKARLGASSAIHNRLIRYQRILEGQGLPISHAPVMERLYWTTLVAHAVKTPGTEKCLALLKMAGLRLGIATDMTADWQYVKLERLGILNAFDFMVSSEEAGAEKPSPAFFACCLEKARCAPAECAFVGDSLKKDCLGALSAGMHPLWYAPEGGECPPTVKAIRSLAEVPEVLAGF